MKAASLFLLVLSVGCFGKVEEPLCKTDVGSFPPDYVFHTVEGGTQSANPCNSGDRCAVAIDGEYVYGICSP